MKKYIDADSLSKFIADTRYKLPHDIKDFFTRDFMLLNFQEIIEFEPAADVVEVVHSKWERSDKEYSYYQYKCSNCGCDDYTQTDRNGKCKLMNYCPHCGAKMDKEAVNG